MRRALLIALLALLVTGADNPPAEFVPPANAKPARRVGGAAVRCSEDPNLYVSILAPASTLGLTASETPVIYWYLSKPTKDPVEIVISDLRAKGKTILEQSLPGIPKAGLQKIDLAAHRGVKLSPGGSYECVIEIVTSDAAGSRNASAAARIARVEKLTPTVPENASPSDLAAFYARQGIWFDYIARLLDAIHANPADPSLLTRLGGSLKKEKLIWKKDGHIDELTK